MRWFTPVLTVAIGLTLAACSPAEAPTVDDPATPPATESTEPAPPDPAAPAPQVIHYDCEGTPVDATFDGHGQVSVAVDGANHVLRTEDGPSGTKYVDDAGVVLWKRGEHDALLTRPDRPDRICSGAPAAPV
ncbi:MliC family protein [Luteimonas sp. 3794]|uniref:MliC family protein n=1 Tax=Luteimonas sp. 3794 TaxID=2817730 RepID=UPI002858BF1E|nr:MliC family protein [Luteimonas sp. 3794]MDR6991015.1 membrane-bound inhibitor of C-type lysozyme [Luteimonas sp. 3794]